MESRRANYRAFNDKRGEKYGRNDRLLIIIAFSEQHLVDGASLRRCLAITINSALECTSLWILEFVESGKYVDEVQKECS